jgi:hypothetical protein
VLWTNLGFTQNYGLSKDSKPDHSCYVFSQANRVYVFNSDKGSIDTPDFWSAHAPMGQAMLYAMDIWHCLARRGISVKSVPVVILAGTKASKEPDLKKAMLSMDIVSKDPKKICCLEAHISIPEYCGEEFKYSIDRLISFEGTTGLSSDEVLSAEASHSYLHQDHALGPRSCFGNQQELLCLLCHKSSSKPLLSPVVVYRKYCIFDS